MPCSFSKNPGSDMEANSHITCLLGLINTQNDANLAQQVFGVEVYLAAVSLS